MKHLNNQLHLIGGQFRGRRLPIIEQPGLRPTPNRVRETLFNWLAPLIVGARCLDAFAGSGALGFEALSRGCGAVMLLEQAAPVARQLVANARTLGIADRVDIVQTDALQWLAGAGRPFDVVFLDPPYSADLLIPTMTLLANNGWVATGARVYLEIASSQNFPTLPAGWELIRDKTAGQVRYGLALVE
ncbi:16S rRNA (guanine(966)-N(2))-methyltransferase RsmD [Chromatium weissei]|nr:16S rRNA (guanine(966)-N(2))-methyltransferase RsmD [Chromatium weissei]